MSVTLQHRFKPRTRVIVRSFFALEWSGAHSSMPQIPLVLSLLLFILTTALVLVSPASLPGILQCSLPGTAHTSRLAAADSLFGVTMATLAVIGFCNAIQQGGFFGIAGQLPPACTLQAPQ